MGVVLGAAAGSVLGGVGSGAGRGRVVDGGAVEVETEELLPGSSLETGGKESLGLGKRLGDGTWKGGGGGGDIRHARWSRSSVWELLTLRLLVSCTRPQPRTAVQQVSRGEWSALGSTHSPSPGAALH